MAEPTEPVRATLTVMGDIYLDATAQSDGDRPVSSAPQVSWKRATIVEVRGTVLAGIWLGVLVGGVGSRLAMLVLRVLSPDTVHGVISDDGFRIGQVTLSGTYNLLAIGALFGVIGASALGIALVGLLSLVGDARTILA